MLKLLRMGETNTYAIVDQDEQGNILCLHGTVRIEEKSIQDYVMIFKEKNLAWFAQLQELRDEIREQLYSQTAKN